MKVSTFTTREGLPLFLALVIGFALAIGFSVKAASTISTNVVTGGHVKATSTVQATGNIIAYGDLLVGGSTTVAVTGLNVGGVTGTAASAFITGGLGVENATTSTGDFLVGNDFRVFSNGAVAVGATTSPILTSASLSLGGAAGTHADLYVSGGLGVANATSSDGDFIVGNDFSVLANGRVAVGATTSPILTGPSLSLGSAAGTHADLYVSGGVGIGNATTTDGILETSGIGFIGGLLKVKGTGTSTVSGPTIIDDDFYFFTSGKLGIATSSPGNPKVGLTASSTEVHFASSATSTVKIYSSDNTANAGKGGCIEMEDSAGTMYKIFITHGSTTLLGVESGSCN